MYEFILKLLPAILTPLLEEVTRWLFKKLKEYFGSKNKPEVKGNIELILSQEAHPEPKAELKLEMPSISVNNNNYVTPRKNESIIPGLTNEELFLIVIAMFVTAILLYSLIKNAK